MYINFKQQLATAVETLLPPAPTREGFLSNRVALIIGLEEISFARCAVDKILLLRPNRWPLHQLVLLVALSFFFFSHLLGRQSSLRVDPAPGPPGPHLQLGCLGCLDIT